MSSAALGPVCALAARDTTTAVLLNPSTAKTGQAVQIKVQVAYTVSVTTAIFPSGTVDFTLAGTAISGCTGVALSSAGAANGNAYAYCTTTPRQAGVFAIGASYSGDAASNPSSGSANLTVAGPASVTVQVSTPNPRVLQPLTLTATVTNTSGLAITGTVDFTSNGTALAGCTGIAVTGGSAACATSFPQTGSYTVTAAYNGDALNQPVAGSATVAIGRISVQNPSISTEVLDVQLNSPYYASQTVTVYASFARTAPAPYPTGSATFYDGSTQLATVPLDSAGKLSFSTRFALGPHSLTVVYGGDAVYDGATTPVATFNIVKTPTTPYIVSVPMQASFIYGQPITLGATFPPPPGSTIGPTGTVTFYDGSTKLDTIAIDSATGHAALLVPSGTLAPFGVGTHSIKAVYSGDANYQLNDTLSAGLISLTFAKASVALPVSATRFQSGKPTGIQATVVVDSPGIVIPGGTVDFTVAGTPAAGCTAMALVNGSVECTVTLAQPVTVNVTYSGDANTLPLTAQITPTSNGAMPGIYIESATTSAVLGQTVTVDVRVIGSSVAPPPTGTVTFTDGSSTSLGSATLGADGHALLVTSSLGLGDHSITPAYGGDANYQSSSAPAISVSVGPDPDSLVISAPAAQIGQPVSLTAVAAPISPGTAKPGGTVTFYNASNSTPISCVLVPQTGSSQCTASVTHLDNLNISAQYVGDTNNAGGSASVELSSAQALAGIYITPSSATPAVGAALTLTATLPAAPGAPAPTGSVTFSDSVSNDVLGTAPVSSNGKASLTTAALALGDHRISASYPGDTNYGPSAAAPVEIVVTKATTKMDLAATPARPGQPVTIQAAVTILGLEQPAQDGTVDFFNGATAIAGCSGVAVQNGIAQCNTTFAQFGTYVVNANYSGGPNITPISASLAVTVGAFAPGFFASAYSTSLPYGAGVGITALAMGTPTPTGTVTFSDGPTTLATVTLGADGTAPLSIPSQTLPPLSVGNHSIVAAYSGDGNYQPATAPAIALTITKASTTVALASPPPQVGQPVALKAAVTVVNPGNAALSGTVDFLDGTAAISGCTGLALRGGVVYCNTIFSQLGNYSITARYNGDSDTNAATATIQVGAGKAVPGVYLASSPTAPVYGVPVTIGALVLGAAGTPAPTGNVAFADGATQLASAPLGADGHASITLGAGLAPVSHTFTATYSGDTNYAGGSATLALVIPKAGTLTGISASFGMPLVATVGVLAPGAGVPTGAVQFFVNGTLAGTGTLSQQNGASTASIPAASWTGTVWAVYQGDGNFTSSVSPNLTLAANALVTIASDHNPAGVGQPVTFTVSVTPSSGTLPPTGQVQLAIDGSPLGSAALVSGKAVFPATPLTAGSHSVSAKYAGDSVYPSASATLVEVVSQSIAVLSLSASSPAAVYGQVVTLTAQLSGSPGGSVQFSEGSTPIGSAPVAAGAAVLTISNLPAGTHSISALWTGDSGAAASASPVTLVVSKAQTATVLASTGLTLSAVVAAAAPGSGTPTGTVKFADALTNAVFAAVPLAGGSAVTQQPVTVDPIAAYYSGDSNFEPSVSSASTPLAAANAASFTADSFAPDEIVTLFGSNLATATASATANPSPSLGGTTANVTDSAGVRRPAPLLFVSPAQASLVIPADTATGPAVIALTNPAGVTFTTAITVAKVAPGIFTMDGSGKGVPAGQIIRVHADGSQDAPENLSSAPIDLGASTDTVYLLLYGTGIRHQTAAAAGDFTVAFAGAQPSIPGLDQVNLLVPASLRGAGQLLVTLMIDGLSSNPVLLNFQ